MLESIIDGLELEDSVKEQLKDKIIEVKPTKEIHVLLDDLKDILNDSGLVQTSILESIKNDCDEDEYHNLLIRLIEYLPMEESTKANAEVLKNKLSHGVSRDQLPKALQSIVDLISMMRNKKNLTRRLQGVDHYLQSNFLETQQSY